MGDSVEGKCTTGIYNINTYVLQICCFRKVLNSIETNNCILAQKLQVLAQKV